MSTEGAGREVAIALQDLVVGLGVEVRDEIAAAIARVHADDDAALAAEAVGDVARGQLELRRVGGGAAGDDLPQARGTGATEAVVVLVEAVLARDLHTFEVFLGDEVHDARDGVRTVHGRRTAGEHFDALDQLGRDLVEVSGRAADTAVGHAATVDEHQGARGAEATQVDRGSTRGAVGDRGVLRGESLRQLVDEVLDAGHALRGDVRRSDLRDRARRFKVRLLQARTGHDDRFERFSGGCFLSQCRRHARRNQPQNQRTPNGECDIGVGLHLFPSLRYDTSVPAQSR